VKSKSIIITGAGGNIGSKLVSHMVSNTNRRIIQLDRRASRARDVIEADLRNQNEGWAQYFHEADTVIHLAANPSPDASWPELVGDNVDALLNVLEAARRGVVKRVIFASSLHAAVGYEGELKLISTDLPARPISFYGASKALGERLGHRYALKYGIAVLCLRIGWVPPTNQAPPDNRRPLMLQHRWLSDADLCQAFTLALDVAPVEYGIANVTSLVEGSPWSLAEAKALLGYIPHSEHAPGTPNLFRRASQRLRNLVRPEKLN